MSDYPGSGVRAQKKSWADEVEEHDDLPPGLLPSPGASRGAAPGSSRASGPDSSTPVPQATGWDGPSDAAKVIKPQPAAATNRPQESSKPDGVKSVPQASGWDEPLVGVKAVPAASGWEEPSLNGASATGPSTLASWSRVADASSRGGGGASADSLAAGLGSLHVTSAQEADERGTTDAPDPSLKSPVLNDIPETHEAQIKVVSQGDTPYTSAKTFEDLQLSEALLRGLYAEMKFERPSKIQAVTLPMILQPPYKNLIAQAHNGSGKTTCFVLGMLSRVDPTLKTPQALCVCPTRELAQQNEAVLAKMGKFTEITCACTAAEWTGVTDEATGKLQDQVVIGTPGTLKRWMTKDRILPPDHMRILVFDEADHMLDQDGFQDDSLRIIQFIKKSSPGCQVVLFSATFNERVKRFAARVVPGANEVYVPREELSLDVIKQYRVRVPGAQAKVTVIKDRIFPAAEKLGQSIIFVKTRESARTLHRTLEMDGHKCTSIQGGMSHEERDSVIKEFRAGTTKILIATDVLARGFDQAQVTLVVNFDLPVKVTPPYEPEYETYLHRIGRSGRFGRKGAAFNLVCGERDDRNLNKIEAHFDKKVPEVDWMDDDAFERVLKEAGLA